MRGNLGATPLRRRRRARDPMGEYDRLPADLRRWLAQAALPWSPVSCRRIWQAAKAEGASVEDALARLDRAERRAMAKDGGNPGAAVPPAQRGRGQSGMAP